MAVALALAVFGLLDDPAVVEQGVTAARIGAAALSLGLTAAARRAAARVALTRRSAVRCQDDVAELSLVMKALSADPVSAMSAKTPRASAGSPRASRRGALAR